MAYSQLYTEIRGGRQVQPLVGDLVRGGFMFRLLFDITLAFIRGTRQGNEAGG